MPLELRHIHKRYGKQAALHDVSLQVNDGDCYGFLGHNGAGKTTLMRIALGLIRADSGTVVVDGFDAAKHPREARTRMGGLIEVPGFHGGWTGRRNLEVLAQLQGMTRGVARNEASRILEIVGLADVGTKPVGAFSHGMKQRLGIGQALLGSPRFVLLDEPTNGLDPEGIAEMRALLLRLREAEGIAVLLSSHQLAEISGLCNRIGVIRQGRLMVEGDVDELLAARPSRFRIDASPADAARAALGAAGAPPGDEGPPWLVEVDPARAADLPRRLLDAGCALRDFGPELPTLEDIYLEATRGGDTTAHAAAVNDTPPTTPTERRAPPWPILRTAWYDARRWLLSPWTLALMLVAPALAVLGILNRRNQFLEYLAQIEDGDLFDTTEVTAFEALGVGLQHGLPILAFIVAGFASQTLSSEFAQGTLRNLLLRPLRRWQVAAGKILSLVAAVGITYGLMIATSFAAAAHWFDFTEVHEISEGSNEPIPVGDTADQLWLQVEGLLAAPVLPLLAYLGLGFFLGAIVRRGAAGLTLALVVTALLDFLRGLARSLDIDAWLPSSYLPSLIGDRSSYVHYYLQYVRGVGNVEVPFSESAVTHPLLWVGVTLLLGTVVLIRRSVP